MPYVIQVISLFLISTTLLAASPKQLDITLEERTSLSLEMSPGRSTRLVFPFLIDPELNEPTFKVSIPNSAIFKIEDDHLAGQNNLVIKAEMLDGSPNGILHISNVFISVNGYHITISLKLTPLNTKHYYTDVFFQLSDTEQKYLVDKIVERRLADLEKRFHEKEKHLDKLAKKSATKNIGQLVLSDQKIFKIKEAFKIKFDSGQRVEVYLDEITAFGEDYFVLLYELKNLSNTDLVLDQFRVEVDDSIIDTQSNCATQLQQRETIRCALVANDSRFFKPKRLSFEIQTDAGTGEVTW